MSENEETPEIDFDDLPSMDKTYGGPPLDDDVGMPLRSLPQVVEVYGSGRDASTRGLRRRTRDKRSAFRIAGTYLVRPGRSFDMTLHVARKHSEEILKYAAEGKLQLRKNGKPFTQEEITLGLRIMNPGEYSARVENLLSQLAAAARKLGPGPSDEEIRDAIEEGVAMPEEDRMEYLRLLEAQLRDTQARLSVDLQEAPEGAEEPEEPTSTPEEPSTEESEEPTSESEEPSESEESEEPTDTTEESEEPTSESEETADTSEESVESEEPTTEPESGEEGSDDEHIVPADMRLPEGYESFKKDDLLDLYAEREEHGLILPEPKTEGRPPTNDQLVAGLTEWEEFSEFEAD